MLFRSEATRAFSGPWFGHRLAFSSRSGKRTAVERRGGGNTRSRKFPIFATGGDRPAPIVPAAGPLDGRSPFPSPLFPREGILHGHRRCPEPSERNTAKRSPEEHISENATMQKRLPACRRQPFPVFSYRFSVPVRPYPGQGGRGRVPVPKSGDYWAGTASMTINSSPSRISISISPSMR